MSSQSLGDISANKSHGPVSSDKVKDRLIECLIVCELGIEPSRGIMHSLYRSAGSEAVQHFSGYRVLGSDRHPTTGPHIDNVRLQMFLA